MEKRLFTVLLITLFATNNYAGNPFKGSNDYDYILNAKPIELEKGQKVYGDLTALKGEPYIYCFYYTDDALFKNAPIIEVRDEFYDDSRLQTEKELCTKFIDNANEKSFKGFYFSGNRVSQYILKLHVTKVDPDGETYLYAMVFDTVEKKLIFQKMYNGNGGTFGSLTNLMGDAAERLGKKVGRDFRKLLTQ